MFELNAALTGARTALGLAKVAIDARDHAKIQEALVEANAKLIDAMSAALASAEKAAALESQLRSLEREKADIERQLRERIQYALHELVPGAFVYASKPGMEGNEMPQHYICQPCFDKGIKSVFRFVRSDVELLDSRWVCPEGSGHNISLGRHGAP